MNRGYACVGLDNPKDIFNIGAAARAVGCYKAAFLAVSGTRASHRLNHIATDTQKTIRHTPFLKVDDLKNIIPHNCVPVAVDLVPEAKDLTNYSHPERAFYIFGAEDATLGDRVLSWCRDIIYIPTQGCMNLAATVNVVLYDRMIKNK